MNPPGCARHGRQNCAECFEVAFFGTRFEQGYRQAAEDCIAAIRERYIDTSQGIKCSDFRDAADYLRDRFLSGSSPEEAEEPRVRKPKRFACTEGRRAEQNREAADLLRDYRERPVSEASSNPGPSLSKCLELVNEEAVKAGARQHLAAERALQRKLEKRDARTVERAAKAAFDEDNRGGHIKGSWAWDTIPDEGRENYRTMIRAALRAAEEDTR